MENSSPLATDSFSYSWLTESKPSSFDSLPDNLISILPQTSFEKQQNFNFDISVTTSPSAFVHADEIFSDGHIMPIYVKRSKVQALKTSTSMPSSPLSTYYLRSQEKSEPANWKRSSKRILQKCFRFVKPLCETIRPSRKSNRVDDLERKVCEVQTLSCSVSPRRSRAYSAGYQWDDVDRKGKKTDLYNGLQKAKSWNYSPQASPLISPSHASTNPWSADAESSIHEAILYCKRSCEKQF